MNKLEQLFHPVVEILVIENVEDEIDPPKVIVDLEVGLMLRVGDVLVFNDKEAEQPKWAVMIEKPEQLYEQAITLTQRSIVSNKIVFYAKIA
jgi:hypothetical protein